MASADRARGSAADGPWSDSRPPSIDGVAEDGVAVTAWINAQEWRVAWYPPSDPPAGVPHGAAAVCLTGDLLVLVSRDGEAWDLPAGRPEPGERPAETLRREIREEACATLTSCTLLGFSQGTCIRGPEQGLTLVRSMWRAEVVLDPSEPRFEIAHRRLVTTGEALDELFAQPRFPRGLRPLYRRAFIEAGLAPGLDAQRAEQA